MALKTEKLSVGYRQRILISDINVRVGKGELIVLIGANGSGKSTLLRTLAAIQPRLAGNIFIDGDSIDDLSNADLARKRAIVLTERNGGGGLTVRELVATGRNPYSGFFGRLTAHDNDAIRDALLLTGIEKKSENYVSQLSDGERQKAMIARAIAQETEMIFLDEPTSFLDISSRFEIMKLLAVLAHDHGKAVLLSTHDVTAALQLCDNLWAVSDGRLHTGNLDGLENSGVLGKVFSGVDYDRSVSDFRLRAGSTMNVTRQ